MPPGPENPAGNPNIAHVDAKTSTENSENGEVRRCNRCGEDKPYTTELWPTSLGRPVGLVCRVCAKTRKRAFDRTYRAQRVAARTQNLSTLASLPAVPPAKGREQGTTDVPSAKELPIRQLEVAKALRAGANIVNEQAQLVLDKLFKYAHDQSSPHHEWAMKLLAERILPKKLYEDLGTQAAGIKPGSAAPRPAVYVNVQAAVPGQPAQVEVREADEGEWSRIAGSE